MVVWRAAANRARISHQKKENDESHEAYYGARYDEWHAPIAFDKVAGDQRTQYVTNRCVWIPDAENEPWCIKKWNIL